MTAPDIEAFFLLIIILPVGPLPKKGNIRLFSIPREQLTVTYTLKDLFICSHTVPLCLERGKFCKQSLLQRV